MEAIQGKPEECGKFVGRNKDGTFKEGHLRIGGRKLGNKTFETDFNEAVEELAKEEGITRSDARKVLLKVAYVNARQGNYSFYKDIHDRIYGTAINRVEAKDITNDIDEMNQEEMDLAKEIIKKRKEIT